MNATIADVAKRAGVSSATVSKYLNKKKISPQNYERIAEAIRELDYHVNDFARGLRTNTSQMIGLLVWSIDNIFATALFKEIEKRITDMGYSLVLGNYNKNAAVFAEKISFLCRYRVDGVIVQLGGQANAVIQQGLRSLQAGGIPFVLVNRYVEGIEADAVLPDDAQAIYDCVTHLLENGHRKIGMIMSPHNDYKRHTRSDGLRKAYADAGLTADEELIFSFDSDGEWPVVAKKKMVAFLQAHPEVTALVLPGYMLTITGISAAYHAGRKIGEDLAVIGMNCDVINEALNPPITYIRLPADEIATYAIEMLIDQIRHKNELPRQMIYIQSHRIDGESVFKI